MRLPVSGSVNPLMFSTTPITGTPTRSNILAPRSASPTAISCGRRHDHRAGHVGRLHQRELGVAGAGREIDDEVVEPAPVDVAQKLLDDLHDDRAAPDGRRVALHEEAEGHELDAECLERVNLALR